MARSTLRRIRIAVWAAIAAVVVVGGWATRLGTRWPSVYYMTGPSMEPTLAAQEYFFTWSPPGTLQRGHLVIFRYVDEDGEFHVLRRLAGLPGDTVEMQAGQMLVNGERQPWPFLVLNPSAWRSTFAIGGNLFTWGPWVVPPDSVLLLSDTRDMVGWPDSRFVGFVPREAILARATRTVTGRRLH